MGARMHVCMGACVYGCMGTWVYGCVCVWVYVCMGVWVHECMGVWVHGYGCMGRVVGGDLMRSPTHVNTVQAKLSNERQVEEVGS